MYEGKYRKRKGTNHFCSGSHPQFLYQENQVALQIHEFIFFLNTTSKIILPTREEQCTRLLGWVFQLKWFFISIWNKAISTPALLSSSNKFFLLFVIMTPPHLYSVFFDIFIMSQRSCYRDSFYDSVKCWSCRSRV